RCDSKCRIGGILCAKKQPESGATAAAMRIEDRYRSAPTARDVEDGNALNFAFRQGSLPGGSLRPGRAGLSYRTTVGDAVSMGSLQRVTRSRVMIAVSMDPQSRPIVPARTASDVRRAGRLRRRLVPSLERLEGRKVLSPVIYSHDSSGKFFQVDV